MKLERHIIGNLEKNFLKRRNRVMETSRADLVMLLNTDIEVGECRQSVELFKEDPDLFAVTRSRLCQWRFFNLFTRNME